MYNNQCNGGSDMTNNETIKFKNAIEFYMLANNLKYATRDNKQSLADQIYGTMILAVAMNSENRKYWRNNKNNFT